MPAREHIEVDVTNMVLTGGWEGRWAKESKISVGWCKYYSREGTGKGMWICVKVMQIWTHTYRSSRSSIRSSTSCRRSSLLLAIKPSTLKPGRWPYGEATLSLFVFSCALRERVDINRHDEEWNSDDVRGADVMLCCVCYNSSSRIAEPSNTR